MTTIDLFLNTIFSVTFIPFCRFFLSILISINSILTDEIFFNSLFILSAKTEPFLYTPAKIMDSSSRFVSRI